MRDDVHRGVAVAEGPRPRAGDGRGRRRLARLEAPRRCLIARRRWRGREDNGKVGIIGYCSGGRQAYLAACSLRGVGAAIDCYGGGVAAKPEELTPRQPAAPIELNKDLQCPSLGLCRVADERASPAA